MKIERVSGSKLKGPEQEKDHKPFVQELSDEVKAMHAGMKQADKRFNELYADEMDEDTYFVIVFPNSALAREFRAAHRIRLEDKFFVDGIAFAESLGTLLKNPIPQERKYRSGGSLVKLALKPTKIQWKG